MPLTLSSHALPPSICLSARQTPMAYHRVLLALDGARFTTPLINIVLAKCVRLTDRLDILVVNSPKAPTSLLCGLLLRLEHSGIDYRLVSGEGDLGEHVLRYLSRFQSVTLVLVDHLPAMESKLGAAMSTLRSKGCRFVSLT